jgi:hypothetical protein
LIVCHTPQISGTDTKSQAISTTANAGGSDPDSLSLSGLIEPSPVEPNLKPFCTIYSAPFISMQRYREDLAAIARSVS